MCVFVGDCKLIKNAEYIYFITFFMCLKCGWIGIQDLFFRLYLPICVCFVGCKANKMTKKMCEGVRFLWEGLVC